MARRDSQFPWFGDSHWRWLDELRGRFDLAIEIVDRDLGYALGAPPATSRAHELRQALQQAGGSVLRDRAAAVLHSGAPHSLDLAGLRIRLFRVPAAPAASEPAGGLLLIADQPRAGEETDATDRRLDAAGQWLCAAIEATIAATILEFDRVRAAQTLSGVVDVVSAFGRLAHEAEILALALDAIALWYDADVRLYRADPAGFRLHTSLPGLEGHDVPRRLAGGAVWGRSGAFRLEGDDLDRFGWDTRAADTLFVPIVVDDAPEWLFTVSGALDDVADATIQFVAETIQSRLTLLERELEERVVRRVEAVLGFGHAPFHATMQLALEEVARDLGAASARTAIYYEGEDTAVLAVGWGAGEAWPVAVVEAGAIRAGADTLAAGAAAGAGATLVVEARRAGGDFPRRAGRVARSAATLLGIWISGALLKRQELRVPSSGEFASEFVERLQDQLDRLGRLKVGGAVAIVLPGAAPASGSQLDEAVHVLQEQVRASDIVGVVEAQGAGVLLPAAGQDVVGAVVRRVLRAARAQGLSDARVGVVTFSASSESPQSLLQRALINAQAGPSLS